MDSSFQTSRKILDLYRNGFVGAICDEEDVKKLLGELPMPIFGAAAYDLKNSGKDKLSLPYKCLIDFDPDRKVKPLAIVSVMQLEMQSM
jgi:hypothetical protein